MKVDKLALTFALAGLVLGVDIIIRGHLKGLIVLGSERYLVGGVVILVCLYAVFAAIKRENKR